MIALIIFKLYLFYPFIKAHNHCLELIWVYYFIINWADLLSFSSILNEFFCLLCHILLWYHCIVYIVLSSAKVASSTSFINKNKSIIKILNKMGLNMEHCGLPKE